MVTEFFMANWYHKEITTIFDELHSSPDGLSADEAKKRLEEQGFNCITEKKNSNSIKRFFLNFIISLFIFLLSLVALPLH